MQTRVRTTITLPEETFHRAKLQAVLEKTTLSELIRRRIEDEERPAVKVKKRMHMRLGSLSLGVNSTFRREEMYEDYIRHKIRR